MQQNNDLTYSDAIEQVMLNNGYFAPLKLIYKNIWKYKDRKNICGLTPEKTIQERIQRDKQRFTRIGLGVYALTKYLDKLPKIVPPKTESDKRERLHAKIQGMLIEIGNSRDEVEDTYTNDKNWTFDNKRLGSLATLSDVPMFTYENIINETVRYFDVIWFNKRKFPLKIFEVEHSTNFRNAFVKFVELQDFRTIFCCVSFENREEKFRKELDKCAFKVLNDKCEFATYEQVENDYNLAKSKRYL